MSGMPSLNDEVNPHALVHAQEDDELFEVYEIPPIMGRGFDMYKDRPISTHEFKTRQRVHQDHDWHRSVHVWIIDAPRQLVALQKRSPQKDTFPNRWDISAAGHMEANYSRSDDDDETHTNNSTSHHSSFSSRETAVREVAEELGISIQASDLEFAFTCPAEQAPWGGCNAYEDVYFVQRDRHDCTFSIGQAEVTSVQWLPMTDLKQHWTQNNREYVPRVEPYKEAFFRHLKTMCASDGI
jgi:isopentenyldiphosphate isomerase